MAGTAELPFPTNVEDFESDERISYSKLDGKYLAVLDDGSEFEFDEQARTWIPFQDEDAAAAVADVDAHYEAELSKKRKKGPSHDSEDPKQGSSKARPSKKPKNNMPPPKQNTAVYVTGLPLDATQEEVYELFSRKCGIIAEEIDSGKPRIKMYTDEHGNFKGDALIVFFKPQSVEMAIMLLDETDFRVGPMSLGTGRMRVQAADSSYKKHQYESGGGASNAQGENKAPRNDRDRQKIIKKTQKLEAKLADWDDDEPSTIHTEEPQKRGKVVILKHMFTLQELEEDPAVLLDIKEDIREECEKFGDVTNVVLYDLEPEGIVSVKFRSADSADECVEALNGRNFAGQVVEAYASAGKEKFRESKKDRQLGLG